MAFGKAKAKPVEETKSKQPDFVARARQSTDSEYYQTIGAAWRRKNDKGEEFLSVKINSQPVGWDGSFLLMRPLPKDEK